MRDFFWLIFSYLKIYITECYADSNKEFLRLRRHFAATINSH